MNAKLSQLIKEKGVVSSGLKLYCKTRWTTASESVNSVINLQQILKEITVTYFQTIILFESFNREIFFRHTNSRIHIGTVKESCIGFGGESGYTCRLFS